MESLSILFIVRIFSGMVSSPAFTEAVDSLNCGCKIGSEKVRKRISGSELSFSSTSRL